MASTPPVPRAGHEHCSPVMMTRAYTPFCRNGQARSICNAAPPFPGSRAREAVRVQDHAAVDARHAGSWNPDRAARVRERGCVRHAASSNAPTAAARGARPGAIVVPSMRGGAERRTAHLCRCPRHEAAWARTIGARSPSGAPLAASFGAVVCRAYNPRAALASRHADHAGRPAGSLRTGRSTRRAVPEASREPGRRKGQARGRRACPFVQASTGRRPSSGQA